MLWRPLRCSLATGVPAGAMHLDNFEFHHMNKNMLFSKITIRRGRIISSPLGPWMLDSEGLSLFSHVGAKSVKVPSALRFLKISVKDYLSP